MINQIDTLAFNVPGLGKRTLSELDRRRDYLAAELYGRERPTLLPGQDDTLFAPLPGVDQLQEVRDIYILRQVAESLRRGPVTLSQLNSIERYLGIQSEVFSLLDMPLQLSSTIEGIEGQIKGLTLAKMPDEMDPGVNPLESIYSNCQIYAYLQLKADTILQIIEKRGGQGEFVKTQRVKLNDLEKLFYTELGPASFGLGGPDAKDCMERAMVGFESDKIAL